MKKLFSFVLAGIAAVACIFVTSGCKDKATKDKPQASSLKASILGIGGGLLKLEGLQSLS